MQKITPTILSLLLLLPTSNFSTIQDNSLAPEQQRVATAVENIGQQQAARPETAISMSLYSRVKKAERPKHKTCGMSPLLCGILLGNALAAMFSLGFSTSTIVHTIFYSSCHCPNQTAPFNQTNY